MFVILLGLPGSGKGTQAKLLEQKLNLKQLSTGDLLRQAVKEGSQLGKKAQSYMQRGELVPDGLMVPLGTSVVPPVYCRTARSSGFLSIGGRQAEKLDS